MFCEGCVNLIWREFKNGLDEFSERKCLLDSSAIKNNLVLCRNRVFKEEKIVDVVDKIRHESNVPSSIFEAVDSISKGDNIFEDAKNSKEILDFTEEEKITVPDNVPIKRGRGRPKRG